MSRTWRDFPDEYIAAVRLGDGAKLGPMSWNDARFAQRELKRFGEALWSAAKIDADARELHSIFRRLRVSCPRVVGSNDQHWVILAANPIVTAIEGVK